jgi:hypothetical protein
MAKVTKNPFSFPLALDNHLRFHWSRCLVVTNGKKILLVATKILLVAMKGVAVDGTWRRLFYGLKSFKRQGAPENGLIISPLKKAGAPWCPFFVNPLT